MKKLTIFMALIMVIVFSIPTFATADVISEASPKEVNVIGQYLGSFGKDGEKTGIFINLYEDNKMAKALIDTYPIPENKSGVATKFIASVTIESGGKVKIFGKEMLEKKDGAQLLNLNFTVSDNKGMGEVNYIDKTEKLSLDMVMQTGDYKPSDWAKANFYSTIASGIVPLELQKKPKASITRGEFAELAINLLMKTENKSLVELETLSKSQGKFNTTFSDVKDNKYIETAARYGIVQGYGDGNYMPNAEITRAEAAVLLSNMINFITKGNLVVTMEYVQFGDEMEVADWAKDAVQLVTKVKVMNGVGENKFNPRGNYTVEQSILTMERLTLIDKK